METKLNSAEDPDIKQGYGSTTRKKQLRQNGYGSDLLLSQVLCN